MRVLVVEDEPAAAQQLCEKLIEGGRRRGISVEVEPVASFREALPLLVQEWPTHVLMDLGGVDEQQVMPNTTDTLFGIAAIQAMIEVCALLGSQARVIACSRRDWPEDVGAAFHAGAHGYLVKTDAATMTPEELGEFLLAGLPGFAPSAPMSPRAQAARQAFDGVAIYRPFSSRPPDEIPVVCLPPDRTFWGKGPFIDVKRVPTFFTQHMDRTPQEWRYRYRRSPAVRFISSALTTDVVYIIFADATMPPVSKSKVELNAAWEAVLRLIAAGKTMQEAALRCGFTPKGVEAILTATADKLSTTLTTEGRGRYQKVARAALGVDILPPDLGPPTIVPYPLPRRRELPRAA